MVDSVTFSYEVIIPVRDGETGVAEDKADYKCEVLEKVQPHEI